jgi:DNA-binding CsgD family transcriptional regulator
VVLLDSQLRPVHFNAEAASILGYPREILRIASLGATLRPALANQINRRTPGPIEFISGRRRYRCRPFELDFSSTGETRGQPRVVVLLERIVAPGVDEPWHAHHQFTNRERETVEYLLKGLTIKQIAKEMDISASTVKSFLKLVMIKVGATNRAGLISKILSR